MKTLELVKKIVELLAQSDADETEKAAALKAALLIVQCDSAVI